MHHHGYAWTGPKQRFDQDGFRRPPGLHPPPPDSRPELLQRCRDVAAAFPVSELPPIQTAHWLMKPPAAIRGTWEEPERAVAWMKKQLAAYATRFDSPVYQDSAHLTLVTDSAAERLGWGGDVSLGFYLERPAFLSLALVTCSPNRAAPALACPARAPAAATTR
ncbi:hypothetical protein ACIQAD_12900 [Streptomyces sp. NPDC088551]|uniref:hypothetical protein n=1 Tax=Streptomyces sp. NPDC088551 TaxID=3365863 RepID=UPI00381F67FF